MEVAFKKLNLDSHLVKDCIIYGYVPIPKNFKNGFLTCCRPGDIEGHKGSDGKYYVLDFGRVMPPEAPSKRR